MLSMPGEWVMSDSGEIVESSAWDVSDVLSSTDEDTDV